MNNHKLVFKLFVTDITKLKRKIIYKETGYGGNNMGNSQFNKIFSTLLIILQLLNLT